MALPGVMDKSPRLDGTSQKRERERERESPTMFNITELFRQVLESHFLSSETEMTEQPCKTEIEKLLAEVKPYQRGHFIFEVPRSLRKLEPDAYVPHVVSIGPYHRKDEHLKKMEKHKRQVLKHVLQRTGLPLDVLVEVMSQLEEGTRNCYDKPIEDFSSQQFVEMMLLDSCFILELLNSYANGWENPTYTSEWWNPIILRGFLPFIQRDLLMLENQLPLSLLAVLVSLTWDPSITWNDDGATPYERVANLALKFFQPLIPGIYDTPPDYTIDNKLPLHLLDIVHQILEPNCYEEHDDHHQQQQQQQQLNSETPSHSVTSLRGTGVSFKKRGSPKITDIDFKDGQLLIIPPIRIHGSTKSIFLNLMAFEQCYPHCKSYVTSYISFMDGLIDSPKDVEYLHKQGIIVHDLGCEDDVATLFNNLRKEIVFHTGDYYLAKVSQKLNNHYKEKWRGWKATLKHEYLKDPWKIISIAAASFLILLTLAQTAYSIVSYHHPSS